VAQLPCGGVVADGSRLHVLFRGWFLSVFKAGKKKKAGKFGLGRDSEDVQPTFIGWL